MRTRSPTLELHSRDRKHEDLHCSARAVKVRPGDAVLVAPRRARQQRGCDGPGGDDGGGDEAGLDALVGHD